MAAVSSRYARALADVITDSKLDANQSLEQLRSLVAAFEISKELREIWETPAVLPAQKRKVLDALAARVGVTERAIRNFIAVLIDQDRIALLPEIADRFEAELNKRIGRVEAEIARLTGKQVVARYATDASLLGGVTVRVGSTIYDGSVRGQLQRIRQQLTES
jgi:F-type H+-transporting ATPase subunit delta